jgi:hypothetical protein
MDIQTQYSALNDIVLYFEQQDPYNTHGMGKKYGIDKTIMQMNPNNLCLIGRGMKLNGTWQVFDITVRRLRNSSDVIYVITQGIRVLGDTVVNECETPNDVGYILDWLFPFLQ